MTTTSRRSATDKEKLRTQTGPVVAAIAGCLLSLATGALAGGITDDGWPMVDPSLDDPGKPWCYFTHPVTCIGMPWQPDATGIQVTPEGAVFTGYSEFCLFWGSESKPLMCRQRQFLEGYIPVVQDYWTDGAIRYDYEVFGAALAKVDESNSNTAIFAKLSIRNTGNKSAKAQAAAAFRQCGGTMREGPDTFKRAWKYAVKDNQLLRGSPEKLCVVGLYPSPARWEAVNGVPYDKPFAGADVGVEARTEVGIAHYEKELAPGETMTLVFKFPRVPTGEAPYIQALQAADYAAQRAQVVEYWKKALTRFSIIHTPGEPIIEQSHRATAAHVMLATRTYEGKKLQTDGLPYPNLFLTAVYDYGLLYDSFGLPEFIRANIPQFIARQQPDGLFVDTSLSWGQIIFCGHGQPMGCLCNHILMSGDAELGRKYFPNIRKGVECIIHDSATQPHGLMRASVPYDNEMIKGQYTCHNYWALIALRSAIRVAWFLGENETAAQWLQFYDSYEALVLKAVRDSAAADGYVPTGLYGFITGQAARAGFDEFRTDQDWENEMLLWPTELVPGDDPLVNGTLKRLHETKYREGIMTYRNGQHLHQYMTSRAANQYIAQGRQQDALVDMYYSLLHMGSAFESFENMIRPWTDRDVEYCPPPHAWGCSTFNGMIRNLFVMEQGGRGGLEPQKRDLLLFNAVSPAWLKDGQPMGIENAPTTFGLVTALMTPHKGGAQIEFKNQFKSRPHNVVVRIPYFVKLESFESDAKDAKRDGDAIRLSPDATRLSLKWKVDPDADKGLFGTLLLRHRREVGFWAGKRSEMPKAPEGFLTDAEKARPAEPLSFQFVLNVWKTEYARRFAEHVRKGGRVKSFQPVGLELPQDRQPQITTKVESLAIGGKVTCSEGSTHPEYANDGQICNTEFWECNAKDAWWQVDLGKATPVSMISIVPLFKDNRSYKFVVKTSMDGRNWKVQIDKRENTTAFGARGCDERFAETPMRFIRVEMFGNSLNEGNHLVEVVVK